MKIFLEEEEWKQLIKTALLDGILRYETADGDIPLHGIHFIYSQMRIEVDVTVIQKPEKPKPPIGLEEDDG